MSSIIITFVAAALVSLALTPVVSTAARRLGIVDQPGGRRVHDRVVPRAGGVAVYVAFVLAFVGTLLRNPELLTTLDPAGKVLAFLLGATLTFLVGVCDDVRSLPPRVKLALQIVAALIAGVGGIQIERVGLPVLGDVALNALALPATVLWFLLIINGLNLIDGLDGLASGITFFAALTLLIVWESASSPLVGLGLAALAGSTLGFLRYNFYPASVFLGDGGAYFLGYTLAALSVLGSIKSEATVAVLIPVIALGVPVIDAVWAPVRRFILGQRLFQPDRDHIHHRLLKLGYTQQRAVLLLYGITILMGLVALVLVHAKDGRAAVLLAFVATGAIVAIRQLGYLTFIHPQRFVGWIGAVSDEMGLRQSRRAFLDSQIAISQSSTIQEVWERMCGAVNSLGMDYWALTVDEAPSADRTLSGAFKHARTGSADIAELDQTRMLFISLPLFDRQDQIGSLVVAKEMDCGTREPYIFRRVDQLRGTVEETLLNLRNQARESEAPVQRVFPLRREVQVEGLAE